MAEQGKPALPAVSSGDDPARPYDPVEALNLVEQAASFVQALQSNADFVSLCTRELLARTREERVRLQSENRELRQLAQEMQQRLLACEAELLTVKQAAQAEGARRADAEVAAFQAVHRASVAERRCDELEVIAAKAARGLKLFTGYGARDPIPTN